MTEKIYLETFEKCLGSVYFPLLLGSENLEEAMYTALLSFNPTTVKVALLFLVDVRCPKCPHSFFCGCLSPTIVHLHNLFLLSTPVAQMLLTPR